MRLYTIALLLLLSVTSVFTQPLCEINQYSLDEGFLQSEVTDILQDKKGLIWISTRNGLSQFDGYTFRNYKSFPGDGSPVLDNRINAIVENAEGDIWCRSQSRRAYLFDVRTKIFIDVLNPIEQKTKQVHSVERVYSLKKGVAWICCHDACCFRVEDALCKTGRGITTNGASVNKIKGKAIYDVNQDEEGDEWVLTDNGVSIIGRKHFKNNTPFSYFTETRKYIWLASKGGSLVKYNPKTEKIDFIPLPSDVRTIYMLDTLNNETLAVGTDAGLILINTGTLKFSQINVKTSPSSLNEVFSVFEDHIGDLWMSNRQAGILHYRKSDGKVLFLQSPENIQFKHPKPNKFLVFEDKYGYVWAVPRDGNLCFFDREEQKLKYYYANPADANSIISPSIRQNLFDKQGNLWMGNSRSFEKLSFFDRNYRIIPKEHDELEVRGFLLDRYRNLWVACKDDKLKILDAHNQCLGYVSESGAISSKPCSFKGNVYCLLEDNQSNIWIGTRSNGLYLLQRKSPGKYSFGVRHFTNDPVDNFSLSNNAVYSLFQDSKRRIWVGTYGGGVNLIEQKSDGSIRFINNRNRLKKYPIGYAESVRCVAERDTKVMLLGTNGGLVSFSSSFEKPEEIKFFRNSRNPDLVTSLSNNDVMYVFTDSQCHTYVLTENGGVNEIVSGNLLSENITFKNFVGREGAFTDLMLSMIEDKAGVLWVVSKQGLSKFNPLATEMAHFHSFTFRQDVIFSEAAIALNALGNIVVGTDKGILEFNPFQIKEYKYVPPIVFTGLRIQGAPFQESIENVKTLIIKPDQRDISIEFAALDYRDSKRIQYAYMMEGLDKDWHYVNQDRSATYINLPHGEYRFIVKSTNSDGVWVNNVRSLAVTVKPMFLETGWAWLLFIFLIVLFVLIVVYVLFAIYRLRHEVDMEHQLSNIKLNFFTDVSHELRTPLTLISSPVTEILENEPLSDTAKDHLTIVKKNADRMLRMVNQILDFRKIQYKKMELLLENTEVVSFVSRIMENFQLIAKEKNITFQLDSDREVSYLWIDKDKVEKIIFNLLSNAFKYTPANKSVTVRIQTEGEKVYMSVVDEGIGIIAQKIDSLFQRFETLVNQDMLHVSSGIGLSLVKEFAELHHGFVKVHSQPGMGSEFKVSFLTGKDHFKKDEHVDFILSDEDAAKGEQSHVYSKEIMDEKGLSENEKWTILIVEDNPELLRFLKNILSHDYSVVEAVNGQDGLEKALSTMPDMIVSDVMMPVMDGLDMVERIKENKDLCHIPVILLSAKSSLGDRIGGLEKGIDDYITKPFSATYLKTRIRTLIGQRRALQELYLSLLSVGGKQSLQEQLTPLHPQISSYDEQFIQRLMDFMEKNMDNTSLAVEEFASAFSMSRAVFFKKIKTLLGISPGDFIRDIRVKRAVQLIESGAVSLTEVAYKCGFSDPNYFGKCFKKQVGVSPSEYKKKVQ
ncbi:MAG: two-component regulator propeller domain-containing protein [Bacteroidota bacterium]|nr:two-component regulator propeller domain-containing protein [Bacteroidota bacterium]